MLGINEQDKIRNMFLRRRKKKGHGTQASPQPGDQAWGDSPDLPSEVAGKVGLQGNG